MAFPNARTSPEKQMGCWLPRKRFYFSLQFGKDRAEYVNNFLFNYSLADSDNWRWNMEQWVSSSLTDRLSLKVTLTWLFNNVPAFRVSP